MLVCQVCHRVSGASFLILKYNQYLLYFVWYRHCNDRAVQHVESEGGRRARRRQAGGRAVAVPVGRGAGPPGARHRRYAGHQQPRRAHAHAYQHIRAGDQGIANDNSFIDIML